MTKLVTLAALAAIGLAGAASAQSVENAIKARQAQMNLYGFNFGVLGAMAKGEMEYDADAASVAANNLAALAKLNQSLIWVPGSDSDSAEKTRALPAIWTEDSDIGQKAQDLVAATDAMAAAAGTDAASLQAQMGDVGKACGACHEDYRQPQ